MAKKSKSKKSQLSEIEKYQLEKKNQQKRYENNLKKLKQLNKIKVTKDVTKKLCKQFIPQVKAVPVKKSVFTEDDWKRFEQEYVAK